MDYTKKEKILHCFKYDSDEYKNIKDKFDKSEEYTNVFFEYLEIRKELISNINELEYKIKENHESMNYDDSNEFKKTINDIKIEILNNQKKLQEKIQDLIKFDDNVLIKLLVIEKMYDTYEGYDNHLSYSSPFSSVDDFMQKMILKDLTYESKYFIATEENMMKYYYKVGYGVNKDYEKIAKVPLSNELVYKIVETINDINVSDVKYIEKHDSMIQLQKEILEYKLNKANDKEQNFEKNSFYER